MEVVGGCELVHQALDSEGKNHRQTVCGFCAFDFLPVGRHPVERERERRMHKYLSTGNAPFAPQKPIQNSMNFFLSPLSTHQVDNNTRKKMV